MTYLIKTSKVAKEWLVNTRNQLHGEFAHHGL